MPRRSPQSDCSQEALGLAVRYLRQQQELTQEELARRIEMHPTDISSIEGGHRNLTFRALKRLSYGLGLPASELIQCAEVMEKKADKGP